MGQLWIYKNSNQANASTGKRKSRDYSTSEESEDEEREQSPKLIVSKKSSTHNSSSCSTKLDGSSTLLPLMKRILILIQTLTVTGVTGVTGMKMRTRTMANIPVMMIV